MSNPKIAELTRLCRQLGHELYGGVDDLPDEISELMCRIHRVIREMEAEVMGYKVNDVLRIRHYPTCEGRYRVWLVESVNLGGTNQEGTYGLRTLDCLPSDETIHVPCIILETHEGLELVQ